MASTASSSRAVLLAQLLRASPETEVDAATLQDQTHSSSPAGLGVRGPEVLTGRQIYSLNLPICEIGVIMLLLCPSLKGLFKKSVIVILCGCV